MKRILYETAKRLLRRGSMAVALIGCCIASFVGIGCATYQIGNQTLYPAEIRTVYVPMFESVSFRRNYGERLTEAVVKEIEKKTPYKVVSEGSADSVLAGRIVAENKNVLFNLRTGDPRELQTNLKVEVSWTDKRGKMLREGPVDVPAELVRIEAAANLVPEVGQSVTTAQQDAICKLAEQIVSLMERPW